MDDHSVKNKIKWATPSIQRPDCKDCTVTKLSPLFIDDGVNRVNAVGGAGAHHKTLVGSSWSSGPLGNTLPLLSSVYSKHFRLHS